MGDHATPPDRDTSRKSYLSFYMRCWGLISMGSRNDANPIRYWFTFAFVLVCDTFLIALMCRHVYVHTGNIDGIAEIVDFTTLFIAAIFRFLHIYFNSQKYDKLGSFIQHNFIRESFGDGRKLTMDRHVKITKILSYTYMVLTVLWLIYIVATRVGFQLLNHNSRGPLTVFAVDMPYDESTQIGQALTYIIHYTTYCTIGYIYVFSDVYWFTILILTTAQFELISHSIRNLSDAAGEKEEIRENDAEFLHVERVVTSCLNHHKLMRRCVHMIEELLSSIVLVDFLHGITSITFILFDMAIAINQILLLKMVGLFGYFFLSVSHMWILDYFGDKVTTKEEDISKAIYEIPWFKYPKKLKQLTYIMMILAGHPRKLTGGKFFSLSLEFFGKSMRTIFSYFTVLLQLRE